MTEIIDRLRASKLRAYEADPGLIKEHFGIEQVVLAGGYGYRQVLELAQNGADAILEAVRNRDRVKAREAMQEHLAMAAHDVKNMRVRNQARNQQPNEKDKSFASPDWSH